MPEAQKNDNATMAGTITRVLPPHESNNYIVKLATFKYAELSPQLIPTSRRGEPAPEASSPYYSDAVRIQVTDIEPFSPNVAVGETVRVRVFVVDAEGVGSERRLKVSCGGQLLQGPASDAVPLVD